MSEVLMVNDGRGNMVPAKPTIVSNTMAEEARDTMTEAEHRAARHLHTMRSHPNRHVRAIGELLAEQNLRPHQLEKAFQAVTELLHQMN